MSSNPKQPVSSIHNTREYIASDLDSGVLILDAKTLGFEPKHFDGWVFQASNCTSFQLAKAGPLGPAGGWENHGSSVSPPNSAEVFDGGLRHAWRVTVTGAGADFRLAVFAYCRPVQAR